MPVVDVNHTPIFYRFDGPDQGPVVMLSHSLASNHSMWDHQIPALVNAGYRVLRYDSRGHGQSGIPEGPYSMEMLTADAKGLMDALALDRVHFCGLSLGGMVGQRMGVLHGDRLISLMLCSTAAYIGLAEIWDERIATVRRQGMEAVVDGTLDRWFTAAGQKRLPTEVETVRQMIVGTSVEGFCACGRAIQGMDQRQTIGQITVRTQVVVGEEDPGTPVSVAEFIHSQITGSALTIIPEAAHFLQMEQVDGFNHILLDFLNVRH